LEKRIIPIGSGPRARVLIDGPLGHDCFRTALCNKAGWQGILEMELFNHAVQIYKHSAE
jgi:hypothetical protein